MAFGVYPETSLADARQKREETRRLGGLLLPVSILVSISVQ